MEYFAGGKQDYAGCLRGWILMPLLEASSILNLEENNLCNYGENMNDGQVSLRNIYVTHISSA
jgi:hypothetical protein